MYKFFAYIAFFLFCASGFGNTIHKVRKGETLSQIANAYNVTASAIKSANNLRNANQIRIGQKLKIPADPPRFLEYRIRKGDSLSKIAQKHGVSLRALSTYNNIRNANQIRIGQVIKIPIRDKTSKAVVHSALSNQILKALRAVHPKANRWKHIVIHHSGSSRGSAKAFDRFHRIERHMENGLAYHFVIGNGRDMGDGEIHVGDRWKRQIQGGHLSSYALNQISIGICLVGNFEKTKPTRKQMQQLEALTEYLMSTTSVPANRVTTHTRVHPKHTVCPGRHFPIASFKKKLGK